MRSGCWDGLPQGVLKRLWRTPATATSQTSISGLSTSLAAPLETVYRPPLPCATWWNYACGTEVTIRVRDARVPACDDEPDLPGCVVQVLSIGRNISISEVQGPGAPVSGEGLTSDGAPFGGKLEPRVWLSRTALRDDKNVSYYRWSYRRLTAGDGLPCSPCRVPGLR